MSGEIERKRVVVRRVVRREWISADEWMARQEIASEQGPGVLKSLLDRIRANPEQYKPRRGRLPKVRP